ncbi:MAG: hypothetical protein KGL39_39465 [Patescibacteria group bacterium]|nr:hypothetical protein [Patescibacteria group bacterium]
MAEDKNNILSGEGGDSADPLGAGARERIKRGRKSSKVSSAGATDRISEAVEPTPEQLEKIEQMKRDLAELYDPKAWQRTATFPLDIAQFLTGAPEFEPSREEREMMGGDLGLVIRFWSGLDPKYLVLLRFGLNMFSVMSTHWIAYKLRLERERQEALKVAA